MTGWKKAGFGLITNWIESSFVILLVAGFVLGKLIIDASFSFLLLTAAGLVVGRLVYLKRENDPLPFKAISTAFLFGFIFGHRVGNGFLLVAAFSAAAFLSYKLHERLEFLA